VALARRGDGLVSISSVLAGPRIGAPAYHEDRDTLSLVIPNGGTELVVLAGDTTTARQGNLALDGVALWAEREAGGGPVHWLEAVGARRILVGQAVILDSRDPRDAGWIAGPAPLNSN
jgi:hypothetical protein